MSGIKALDKLREKIRLDVNNPWSDLQGDLLAMCDKVEREIAERFMELPVDADGVPVRVGDKLRGVYETFEVCAVSEHYAYWEQGRHWDRANECHHVGPRTLEDVLWDYRCAEITREEAAAEIRELMANDKLAPESGVSAHGGHSNDGEAAL